MNAGTLHILEACEIPSRDGVWDVSLTAGKIAAMRPSTSRPARILLPLMADAHVHLDKTFTVTRTGYAAASLFDAIERMHADKPNWSDEDIHSRATGALENAWAYGVGALRTHVDWDGPKPPRAWHVLQELQQEWLGRIEIELAALAPLDLYGEGGAQIAKEVQSSDAVLGAFIYKNENLVDKVGQLFDLARKNGLALDFHVDEGLESDAMGFDAILGEAQKSPDLPVLCGHCCALSTRDADDVQRLLDRAAKLNISIAALPTTNLFLQDNTPGRTPKMRGITTVVEAKASGIPVILASDNVRDVFYPYGDYDLLDVYKLGVQLAHLDPQDWLTSITHTPWDVMALSSPELKEGAAADFIEIEEGDLASALSKPLVARHVWRSGKRI